MWDQGSVRGQESLNKFPWPLQRPWKFESGGSGISYSGGPDPRPQDPDQCRPGNGRLVHGAKETMDNDKFEQLEHCTVNDRFNKYQITNPRLLISKVCYTISRLLIRHADPN